MEKWQIPTRTQSSGTYILRDVIASAEAALARNLINWEDLEGMGMGVPGPVSSDGTVFRCVNLGWDVFNVPERMRTLEPRLNRVQVSNDVNAATLGELWRGAAKGRQSAFMVTLGTGVGGGLVMDGKILPGASGSAGEIGHVCVNPQETETCSCGKHGCLEQYCSARGLVQCTRKALRGNISSVLRDTPELTAETICNAARNGDAFAAEMLDQMAARLSWSLTAVAGSVDPQIFVIGGGLSHAGNVLLDRIRRYYQRYAFHAFRDTAFVLAELGNDAGIYGCIRMLL